MGFGDAQGLPAAPEAPQISPFCLRFTTEMLPKRFVLLMLSGSGCPDALPRSLLGWAGENQHGEADFLRPLGPGEAGSHRCLPLRAPHPRREPAPIRVRALGLFLPPLLSA